VTRNTHPEFVGIPALIERHAAQVAQFEQWAADGNWQAFHDNHYDWWAFPIDKPSSYAFAYTVYSDEIAQMRQDEAFMQRHRLGAQLLLLSWGWGVLAGAVVSDSAPGQAWANWPIRLSKCARSMWLFGQDEQWGSAVEFARVLKARGESFEYGGRDLFEEIVGLSND
jgi:hypothetical protein